MAEGQFIIAGETPQEHLDWGRLRWMSHPPATGADQLTVIDVTLSPGKGHDFHKHPDQEEVIYVTAGRVEQWVGEEKRLLGPGDAAFIPPGVVHASFNAGDEDARVVAILGPCIGVNGYVSVEVAGEAPWKDLRI
ncbi:cupin domain-containing protein [Mesorhizobium sp. BR1-1-16]|uniref:cupin domain-containing protein n=1 Tax=Mesorhizobium sp. BR1-1-16 TaxID=2876653 RepID=UPI001CCC8AC7|nr:cupin domain-containing protein [Mesorhizobium sp. BR1-1-16]MBZ9936194.1 cupin domain-containing protein [Mesorhizobium sp. BR1-1-16]